MARLGADFASININNSHVTHHKLKNTLQIPGKTEGSLLLPVELKTIGMLKEILNLKNSEHISLSDAGKHSTRMRCYLHSQQNHFLMILFWLVE